MKNDTIAAISTGALPAGIAIVRISGSESVIIAERITKKPLSEAFSHTIHFCNIYDGEEKIDEALVSVMLSPNTYTGEDIVEINCHGSLLIQRKILNLVVKNGARPAGPGEFTMRAFLNKKMDLAQAEAVMDIISSDNDMALSASIANLSGKITNIIVEMRQNILNNIAYIEAALDDPEHMSLEGFQGKLNNHIIEWKETINNLINNFELSKVIKNGLDCAIIGGVNVGKSSLLNSLIGQDRAIVTDIPGTTRDTVDVRINMGDFTLNVIDTAGIRESNDVVEKIGIEKSLRYLESADIVIFVIDSSIPLGEEEKLYLKSLNPDKGVIVLNKIDLKSAVNEEDIKNISNANTTSVSAKELLGIDELKSELRKIVFGKERPNKEDVFITNERHLLCLNNSLKSLNLVQDAMQNGMSEEIYTIDLTDAYASLGKIIGLEIEDDVIDEVFSKFCIGK